MIKLYGSTSDFGLCSPKLSKNPYVESLIGKSSERIASSFTFACVFENTNNAAVTNQNMLFLALILYFGKANVTAGNGLTLPEKVPISVSG